MWQCKMKAQTLKPPCGNTKCLCWHFVGVNNRIVEQKYSIPALTLPLQKEREQTASRWLKLVWLLPLRLLCECTVEAPHSVHCDRFSTGCFSSYAKSPYCLKHTLDAVVLQVVHRLSASPHLPLGHTAVVLCSLLEQLLADGFSFLLQAAFSLQLLKLQVLKLFGSCFQCLSVLMECPHTTRAVTSRTEKHAVLHYTQLVLKPSTIVRLA